MERCVSHQVLVFAASYANELVPAQLKQFSAPQKRLRMQKRRGGRARRGRPTSPQLWIGLGHTIPSSHTPALGPSNGQGLAVRVSRVRCFALNNAYRHTEHPLKKDKSQQEKPVCNEATDNRSCSAQTACQIHSNC